jgi:hypothetical protein
MMRMRIIKMQQLSSEPLKHIPVTSELKLDGGFPSSDVSYAIWFRQVRFSGGGI